MELRTVVDSFLKPISHRSRIRDSRAEVPLSTAAHVCLSHSFSYAAYDN